VTLKDLHSSGVNGVLSCEGTSRTVRGGLGGTEGEQHSTQKQGTSFLGACSGRGGGDRSKGEGRGSDAGRELEQR